MTWAEFRKRRASELDDAIRNINVDDTALGIITAINRNHDLITTSSCSGRIVLLQFDLKERKKTSEFYKKWHRKVEHAEVEMAICTYNKKQMLWFKVEPFILHVATKDMETVLCCITQRRKMATATHLFSPIVFQFT